MNVEHGLGVCIVLTPAFNAGVIVVAVQVSAMLAGINIVGVPQTKPMQ